MRWLKRQIDLWAIEVAARSLPRLKPRPGQAAEIANLLAQPDFFQPAERAPQVVLDECDFHFASDVATPFPRNNTVHGKLFKAGPQWRTRASVVLVHGWNAELHYIAILPRVARALNRCGLNAALIQLPYHMHRRPGRGQAVTNFISEDIPRMLEATRQAIADLNSLCHWLKAEVSPAVALWGFSLGAWLAGLHLCASSIQDAAVLTTPVSNLETAIRELKFCHPIRAALEVAPYHLRPLNLATMRPKIPPSAIHLVEARDDCFVPGESYRELAEAWSLPKWTIAPESHISILVSRNATREIIDWLTGHLPSH